MKVVNRDRKKSARNHEQNCMSRPFLQHALWIIYCVVTSWESLPAKIDHSRFQPWLVLAPFKSADDFSIARLQTALFCLGANFQQRSRDKVAPKASTKLTLKGHHAIHFFLVSQAQFCVRAECMSLCKQTRQKWVPRQKIAASVAGVAFIASS